MMVLCNEFAFNTFGLILSWFEITGNETLQKETILIQISIHSISRSGVNPGQHFSMADGGTIGFLTYWKRTQKTRICCRLCYCSGLVCTCSVATRVYKKLNWAKNHRTTVLDLSWLFCGFAWESISRTSPLILLHCTFKYTPLVLCALFNNKYLPMPVDLFGIPFYSI